MKKIRMWFYKQAIKDATVLEIIERERRREAVAYNNWINSKTRQKPIMNDNNTWKTCWEMYDYYHESENRITYINHAERG